MTRWDFLTCPFGPDYCCHYRIFPTRYLLLYPPLPLTLAFEVCLAGLMLIVAAPVDLVLGLTLIVATPQTPFSIISLKCWVVFFIKTIAIYIPDYICTLFSPHYILIIFTFLDWFSARTSAKLSIALACFAVNFSWMLKKYVVNNRLPSKPWQNYSFRFKVWWVMKVWLSFQSISHLWCISLPINVCLKIFKIA